MPSRGSFGIEVLKSMEMKNNINFSPRRVGKWSLEEEHFAKKLIEQFEAGTLTDCQAGTTLRSYLAKRLNCDPMRISKKFAGKSIGKHTYVSRLRDLQPSIPSCATIPVPDIDIQDLQSMGLVQQPSSVPASIPPLPPLTVSQVPNESAIPNTVPMMEETEKEGIPLQTVVSFDTFTKYHKVQLEESLKPSANNKKYSDWPGYQETTATTAAGATNSMNSTMKKRPFAEAFPGLPDIDIHTIATTGATASTDRAVGLSIDDDEGGGYDHPQTKKCNTTNSIPSIATTIPAECSVNTTDTCKPVPITWIPVFTKPSNCQKDEPTPKQFAPVATVPRWDAPLATWEQQGVGELATPTAILSSDAAAGGIASVVSPSATTASNIATSALHAATSNVAAPTSTLPPVHSVPQTIPSTLSPVVVYPSSTTLPEQSSMPVPAAIPCAFTDHSSETGTEIETMTESGSQTGTEPDTMIEMRSQKANIESDYCNGTETGYHTEASSDCGIPTKPTTTNSSLDVKGWNDVLDILLFDSNNLVEEKEELSPPTGTGLYRQSSLSSFII